MLLTVPKLLTEDQLKKIDGHLAKAKWEDGATTAGKTAKRVKNNMQVDRKNTPNVAKMDSIIEPAISTNTQIRSATLPIKVRVPLYNKYTEGMEYGPHVDNPVMMEDPPMRTDVSITVFLTNPEDYEGGELVIGTGAGDAKVKLPRGDAVLYSTDSLHMVQKITKGERLAACTWIQSIVADTACRQLLHELDIACQLVTQKSPDTQESRILNKTYGNLIRMWGGV